MLEENCFIWCYHQWRYCDKNCTECDRITEEQKKVKDNIFDNIDKDNQGNQNE